MQNSYISRQLSFNNPPPKKKNPPQKTNINDIKNDVIYSSSFTRTGRVRQSIYKQKAIHDRLTAQYVIIWIWLCRCGDVWPSGSRIMMMYISQFMVIQLHRIRSSGACVNFYATVRGSKPLADIMISVWFVYHCIWEVLPTWVCNQDQPMYSPNVALH